MKAAFERKKWTVRDYSSAALAVVGSRLKNANPWLILPLGVPLLLYTALYANLRGFGAPVLLGVCACAALMIVSANRFLRWSTYLPFFTFSSLILLLSVTNQMPKAWTVHHDNAAAVRQWIWIPLTYILSNAFYFLIKRYKKQIFDHSAAIAVTLYAVSKLSNFALPSVEEGGLSLYTLTNNVMIIYLAAAIWLFKDNDRKPLKFLFVLVLMTMSTSAQSLAVSLLFVLLCLVRGSRLWVGVTLSAFIAIVVVAPSYYIEIDRFDPNSGIRAAFWRDAWLALWDTWGIGVGYGTEGIRGVFSPEFRPLGWHVIADDDPGRLFVANHNFLIDVLLRNGVAGGILFMVWFLAMVLPPRSLPRSRINLWIAVASLLIISASLNVAFASMNLLFGTCLCLAVLQLLALDQPVRFETLARERILVPKATLRFPASENTAG